MRSRRQQRQRTRDGAALSSGPASGHRAGRGRTARTHAAGASPTAVQSVLARRAFARAQTKELFFVKKAKNKCDTQRQTRRTSSAAARASAPASQPAPPPPSVPMGAACFSASKQSLSPRPFYPLKASEGANVSYSSVALTAPNTPEAVVLPASAQRVSLPQHMSMGREERLLSCPGALPCWANAR